MAHAPDTPLSRRLHDLPGTVVACLFIVLAIVLITSTGSMTPMGSVFPIAISTAMIVFSLVLIVRNVVLSFRSDRSVTATNEESVEVQEHSATHESMPRRILFLVAMAAWIFLIPILGFFVASLLAFFTIMAIASHERMPFREVALLVVIGVVILTAFYLLMAEVLLIPMPTGLFF